MGAGRPTPGAPPFIGGLCRRARGRSWAAGLYLLHGETSQRFPAAGARPFSSWRTFRGAAPGPGTPRNPAPQSARPGGEPGPHRPGPLVSQSLMGKPPVDCTADR